MGFSRFEELEAKCKELEKLYQEAVQTRDEAIEERNRATIVLAFQLEKETAELTNHIEELSKKNASILDENEDLSIKLEYARRDWKNLQKKHIKLQLESEQVIDEKGKAIEKVNELEKKNSLLEAEVEKLLAQLNNTERTSKSKSYDNILLNPTIKITNYCSDQDKINTKSSKENNSISKYKEGNKVASNRKTPVVMDGELDSRPPIALKKNAIENEYDVHEELGKGKFGVVRRVTSKSSKDVYAAKYIKTSPSAAGSSRDEVLREINIMRQLHHKRLVGLLDTYESGKTIIMIMEFVSGGELFERVVDEDCLTEKEAAYYMHQILEGVQHMHGKNILHLDLKPENIVCVSKDSWEIKLIDFGLAQELIQGTKMKAMKGTPEFMAPETVNFEPVSKPADMWSVGVIAYILLSGLSPFMGDDNNETLSNVNTAEWDFDDEAFDIISDEAKEFISQLLIKDPRKRNTVEDCLKHEWMKKSESSSAVKIDTKKLKQFLAKRRWQKSVNALVAVRRLSSMSSLLGLQKSRPSIAPMLAKLPAGEEEEEEESDEEENHKSKNKDTGRFEVNVGQNDSNVQVNGRSIVDQKSRASEEKHFQRKPAFAKELVDVTASEGDSITMEVVINGDVKSEVEWFFDGGEVNLRDGLAIVNHGDGTHAIIIDECEEEDTGEYCCIYETDDGKAITRGYLTVEVLSSEEGGVDMDPPVFTKELTDITVKEGEKVTMEVEVSGEDYKLEWFKNAVDIVEGGRFSFMNNGDGKHALVITNVEDDDTGEYCCVAENDGGRNTCAGNLTVEVEGEDDEEDGEENEEEVSEEETDEEMYEEKDNLMRKEYIEDFYAIEEEIGRGRFGIARKCVHIVTGIHFVAKFIKARPSQKNDFKREIEVMNQLRHRSLCRIREAFEQPRELVIVMEYNRGGDLLQRISESPMSEPDSVEILQQILDALNYMHGKNFMHLDVKPENVMFKRDGGNNIRLIDFSLARKYDPNVGTKISQGTAEYVAPEVVNYESVTPATDMWAVGITSFMMLSGISPFLSDSEAETFANITSCKWKFTEVFHDVSEEAKEFITQLIVKAKSERLSAGQCLQHPWIKAVGLHRDKNRVSTLTHTTSLSDISNSLLTNGDLHESISSVESYLRLNSASDDVFVSEEEAEKKQSTDTRELEATLQAFLLKLREVECERAELEEKVKTAETSQQKMNSEQNEYVQRISKLEKENEKFVKELKSKNDLLVKIGDLETIRKELEEKLEEKRKTQESVEKKYNDLRIKMEQYDMLEEKMYRFEREKKENLLANKRLQEKLEESKTIEKDLEYKQLQYEERKSQEISKIMEEKEEIKEKYNRLAREKEKLVSELTEKFNVLEEEKKNSIEQKEILKNKLKELESENRAVEEDLKRKSISSLEKEKKKTAEISNLRKEKHDIEDKYTKLRLEKDNLVSDLKKKFSALEKQKKEALEKNEGLEKKVKNLENEAKERIEECGKLNEDKKALNKEIERLSNICMSGKDWEAKIATLNKENTELEKEGTKLRKQKEEVQKTCEELASKLSKSYKEAEKLKSLSDQALELDNLRKENKEMKKNLSTAQENYLTLQSEVECYKNNISDLRKELQSEQSCFELNQDIESLKTTIFDLEATILTHKSTIAVYKGEIDLMQERLAVEQEEKAQMKEDLTNKKREVESLSARLAKATTMERKPEEKKHKESSPEELEKIKQETKRLVKEKEDLKLLLETNKTQKQALEKEIALLQEEKRNTDNSILISLRQKVDDLQTSSGKLWKQNEELRIGITLRDKKIKLYETELEELQITKTQGDATGFIGEDGTQNGITGKSDKELEEPRGQLRKEKHKSAVTEIELERLKGNYQIKLKAEREEMENKWAKRLRKECSELQADLAEKHAQEKRLWLIKENELQNMIRQMKMLLDKRAKEAAEIKKKLEHEVAKAKAFQENTASLDSGSISDEAENGDSHTKKEKSVSDNKDSLHDRDLRRVAYKLTKDEWSQLGTFLGVADSELHKLMGLNMGAQEKAFRLLVIWRTRSSFEKNQLVSQLAVALEEINRKDLAQFVVEQMMSGKPRKKFFGW